MYNKIEKVVKIIKENRWIHYLIIIIIGVILSIPLLNNVQIRETHDGALHFLRLLGTVDTLEIGQIPPLINQNYCSGARIFNELILSTTCNISSIAY